MTHCTFNALGARKLQPQKHKSRFRKVGFRALDVSLIRDMIFSYKTLLYVMLNLETGAKREVMLGATIMRQSKLT
jgi:hypothetical protein